jgi:aminoglycoside phosphotransferase (APT) family kinase protein
VGSSGVALVVGENAVLRVALGSARHGLEAHVRALERLGGAGVDPLVGARLPSVLASGHEGAAGWALETRLPGAPPGVPIDDTLALECVDFLVALHATGGLGGSPWRAASCAAEVARLTGGDTQTALDELSARADRTLETLPRGLGHGDFWAGNLLVAGGRLAGVVDWAGASGGRLPLLDLLQLRVADLRDAHGLDLGPALLRFAALRDPRDDAAIRDYADRLGLELGEPEWHALLVAFWLDALARALRDPDPLVRPADPAWREANVERVIRELGARAPD